MPKKRNFLGGMQNYNPNNGEYESRLVKEGGEPATKENMPGGEDNKKSFKSFKKDKGNELDSRIEKVIKERVKKGWDMEGTFDVQAVKDTGYYGFGSIDELEKHTFGGKNTTFDDINAKRMGVEKKKNRPIKSGSVSQEIGSIYEYLSDLYDVDLENLVYGSNGFMKSKYPNGFPDFAGDLVYSEKYWKEFENWLKKEKGIKLKETKQEYLGDLPF